MSTNSTLHPFLQPAADATAEAVQGNITPQPGDPEAPPRTLSDLFRWVSAAVLAPMLQQQQLLGIMSVKFADLGPRLALAETALASSQAQASAQAAQLQFLDAKATLTASATDANALAITALQTRQGAGEAAQALLAARLTTEDAAIAAAQATATAAQFAASQAQAGAATAQAKADADATLALAAQAAAEAAKATATQALAASTALAARFRTKRMVTPGVALGGTMSMAIVWDVPFADDKYNAVAEFEGLALLGLTAVVTNRTATGCTVTSKNVLGLQLLAGAGTVTVTAIHDAA